MPGIASIPAPAAKPAAPQIASPVVAPSVIESVSPMFNLSFSDLESSLIIEISCSKPCLRSSSTALSACCQLGNTLTTVLLILYLLLLFLTLRGYAKSSHEICGEFLCWFLSDGAYVFVRCDPPLKKLP